MIHHQLELIDCYFPIFSFTSLRTLPFSLFTYNSKKSSSFVNLLICITFIIHLLYHESLMPVSSIKSMYTYFIQSTNLRYISDETTVQNIPYFGNPVVLSNSMKKCKECEIAPNIFGHRFSKVGNTA